MDTAAPSLAYTVYNPIDNWNRVELLALQRGSILIQIADSGAQCFAPETIALWYKRRQNDNIGDWALVTSLPAIGSAVPVSSNDDLCALPVGSVYVQTAGVNCVDQLWLKIRQECGASGCNDWVPLLLTLTRSGDEVSFDADTNTLNLPVEGNLTSEGDGEYRWTPDNNTADYAFYIPSLVDNADGTYTYDPRDGTSTITINTNSGLVIPADISAVRRPWVEVGNAQATNATNVTESVTIFHTGTVIRGSATQGSTGTVGLESGGNTALGAVNHDLTSSENGLVAGNSNEVKSTKNGAVLGGLDNAITGAGAPTTNINDAIVAGNSNTITDSANAIIGAGTGNDILSGAHSAFIGAGQDNESSAGSLAVIVGGKSNKANATQGQVLGGSFNEANGAASTALGLKSQITHNYAFLINTQPGADPNADSDPFASAAASEFAVRCDGVRIFTNLAQSAGMTMAAGASSWSAVSDERAKNNITPQNVAVLDGYKILQPVSYWMGEWIHAGITAQNWYEAFPFVEPKYVGNYFGINQAERDGVQDLAIKQLLARVEALEARLAKYEGD